MNNVSSNSLLPIFSTTYSIGRSLLTTDPPSEDDRFSVFSLAKRNGLKEVFVIDSTFAGFRSAHLVSLKCGIPIRWGLKLTLCADISVKTDESRLTEHKVIVWMLNDAGYKPLAAIYSKAATEGFYKIFRTDMKIIAELWCDSLAMMLAPYDNMIHNNLLKGYFCLPDWCGITPIVAVANMGLPFDPLLSVALYQYAEKEGLKLLNVHPIYYPESKDFMAYLALRCIESGTTFDKPELPFMSSRAFSLEAWRAKCEK